jgi:hypothetical protein
VDEAREGVMIAPLCSPDEVSLVHVRLGERPPSRWLDSVWRRSSLNRSPADCGPSRVDRPPPGVYIRCHRLQRATPPVDCREW